MEAFGVSERRAFWVLEHPWYTQRHRPVSAGDRKVLAGEFVELASWFGRYGYRRIASLLGHVGWNVNHKGVERVWRREAEGRVVGQGDLL